MKKDYFTHSFQKQQTNKKTEKDREKAEDVRPNLLYEKQHFSDTSQQASKKCENWRNHFSRHRKRQNKKKNVKHVQQIKETDKIVFLVTRQKKKAYQKFTKIQKIVKKGYTWRKRRDNPRARKSKNMKWRKKRKKKHGETKKKNKWIEDEQKKEGIKRQNRHSKRENVDLKRNTPFLSLSQKRDSKNANF